MKQSERDNKLFRIYSRLNSPKSGASKKAENITYYKQHILDAIEELKEIMIDEGFKFEKGE